MSILDRVKKAAKGAAQGAMKKAIEIAPDRMIPGGAPIPRSRSTAMLKAVSLIDGLLKVQERRALLPSCR